MGECFQLLPLPFETVPSTVSFVFSSTPSLFGFSALSSGRPNEHRNLIAWRIGCELKMNRDGWRWKSFFFIFFLQFLQSIVRRKLSIRKQWDILLVHFNLRSLSAHICVYIAEYLCVIVWSDSTRDAVESHEMMMEDICCQRYVCSIIVALRNGTQIHVNHTHLSWILKQDR